MGQVLQLREVKEKLATLGLEPGSGSVPEFRSYIQEQATTWPRVVKAAGLKSE